MKILITGASGLLGHNTALATQDRHEVLGTYLRSARPAIRNAVRLDLTARHAATDIFRRFRPHVLIHTAAMTQPAQCEKEPDLARKFNVDATRQLAQMCEKTGARMIHISTDLVFDGRKGDYVEGDEPAPLSRYGESKLTAEREVGSILENHTILRVALMYGKSPGGRRSADEAIVAAQREGRTLHLFTDEYRTPISAAAVADVLLRLIDRELTGLYHCGGSEKLSRYDFAKKLSEFVPLDMGLIKPASITEAPTVPPRAPDVSLNSEKLQQALGIKLPDIASGFAAIYRD